MTSLTANAARSTMRRAALIGGLGLLLMSVLAGLANFAVLERVVSEGDAARTTSEILEAFDSFRGDRRTLPRGVSGSRSLLSPSSARSC